MPQYTLSLDDLAGCRTYSLTTPDDLVTARDLRDIPIPDGMSVDSTHGGWLVRPCHGGFLHTALHRLDLVDMSGFGWTLPHDTWRDAVLSARDRISDAKRPLAHPAEYHNGAVVHRARPQDRKIGHVLVLATKQTSCCGQLTQIAVSSVFGNLADDYKVWPEPRPGCEDRHPPRRQGSERFTDILRDLRKRIAENNEVLVWGPRPLLALYAQTISMGAPIRFDQEGWVNRIARFTDIQALEAVWRTGSYSPAGRTLLPPGRSARSDIDVITERLMEIGASLADLRESAVIKEFPVPDRPPLASPDDASILLPVPLGRSDDRQPGGPVRTQKALRADGPTDLQITSATLRLEQRFLRARLLGGREVAPCALCGQEFTSRYLTAAHIKARYVASDDERKDIRAIGMLACPGCDKAYEFGDLFVDSGGTVCVRQSRSAHPDGVAETLRRADGRSFEEFTPKRERYFNWHRDEHGHSDRAPR